MLSVCCTLDIRKHAYARITMQVLLVGSASARPVLESLPHRLHGRFLFSEILHSQHRYGDGAIVMLVTTHEIKLHCEQRVDLLVITLPVIGKGILVIVSSSPKVARYSLLVV